MTPARESCPTQRMGPTRVSPSCVPTLTVGARPSLPTQKFVPHCTILHRCAPDTGCCAAEEQHCQVKSVQEVPLPFFVLHLAADGSPARYEPTTLLFENHTECECRLRNEPIR